MYEKVAHLVSIVLGSSIDPCIMLYSDYKNKSGAVSVIVGRVERTFLNEDKEKVVDQFLSQHRQFSQKFEYGQMCWAAYEDRKLLVGLFKYRHERKIKITAGRNFY